MENSKNSEKILKIIKITLFVVYALVIFLAFFFHDNMTYDFESENVAFDKGWEIINDDGTRNEAATPIKIENDKIVMVKTLPEVNDNTILTFEVTHSYAKATIEDEVIYEGSESTLGGLTTEVGNYNIIVHLRKEDSGKEIKIEIIRRDTVYPLSIKNMFISSRDSYALHMITSNLLTVTLDIIFVFIGITSFIVLIILKCSKFKYSKDILNSFFYLGCFTILIALWTSGNLSILGILTGKLTLSGIINYASFIVLPVSIIGLVKSLIKTDNKLIDYIQFENCIVILFILIAFLTGLLDLSQTLIVAHINDIILVVALIAFIFIALKDKKIKYNRIIILLFSCLGLLILTGIILYLLDYNYLMIVYISCFASIVTIFIVSLFKLYGTTKQLWKNKEYYYFAYTDELTGIKNRKSYTEKIDNLGKEKLKNSIYFVALDINNLKGMNDKYGHLAGDKLIKETANIITDVFKDFGECYRIGGDEFIVIIEKPIESIDVLLKDLKDKASKTIIVDDISVSLAFGVSKMNIDYTDDIYDYIKQADMQMYLNKKDFYANKTLK